MDRKEALKWMSKGFDLAEQFPERRGFGYVETYHKDGCHVCLSGYAAIASFEGRPFTVTKLVERAISIDNALWRVPSRVNNSHAFYGKDTPESIREMRVAYVREVRP